MQNSEIVKTIEGMALMGEEHSNAIRKMLMLKNISKKELMAHAKAAKWQYVIMTQWIKELQD